MLLLPSGKTAGPRRPQPQGRARPGGSGAPQPAARRQQVQWSDNKPRLKEKKTGVHTALPSRPRPKTLADTGIPEVFIADLMLKHCFYLNFFTMGDLTARLKLPASVITPVLDFLRHEKYLELRGPDPLKPVANALALSHRYGVTEGGKRRAAQLLEYDAYVGPVPVSLEDYWHQVRPPENRAQARSPRHPGEGLRGPGRLPRPAGQAGAGR